ncbi:MAG: carbohydrate ABC transporter permease, partial [Lachnospiraceae bacterium]|nr:carbohydrate ABC transporter permease [Lachnospiraceae bacterium]
ITFRFPYDAVMMRSFIHGIDYTIEEAAQIDGCSRVGTMFHILLPLLKPGIATVAAYAFISCWNEFLYAFMFINEQKKVTLPVGLKLMVSEFTVKYGTLAAGAIIAVAPTLILFSYVQKHLVGGIAAGAVKG